MKISGNHTFRHAERWLVGLAMGVLALFLEKLVRRSGGHGGE